MKLLLLKLEFYRSSEDVAYDYGFLSENEREKIAMIELKSSFNFEDEYNNYVCYYLIDSKEWEKYKKVLDYNLIHYICSDISNFVINNKINLDKILKKYLNKDNIKDYNNFIYDINQWITENLDIDLVLDMIIENGIDSLRKIDRDFLKKI